MSAARYAAIPPLPLTAIQVCYKIARQFEYGGSIRSRRPSCAGATGGEKCNRTAPALSPSICRPPGSVRNPGSIGGNGKCIIASTLHSPAPASANLLAGLPRRAGGRPARRAGGGTGGVRRQQPGPGGHLGARRHQRAGPGGYPRPPLTLRPPPLPAPATAAAQ